MTAEGSTLKIPFNELQVCACHKTLTELEHLWSWDQNVIVKGVFFAMRKGNPQNLSSYSFFQKHLGIWNWILWMHFLFYFKLFQFFGQNHWLNVCSGSQCQWPMNRAWNQKVLWMQKFIGQSFGGRSGRLQALTMDLSLCSPSSKKNVSSTASGFGFAGCVFSVNLTVLWYVGE